MEWSFAGIVCDALAPYRATSTATQQQRADRAANLHMKLGASCGVVKGLCVADPYNVKECLHLGPL